MKGTGAQSALEGLGGNRTGVQTAPELARELIEGAAAAEPSSEGGPEDIAEYRGEYIKEGFPIGSLPGLPVSEEVDAEEEAAGMAVLLDKLSERLAFERTGTRLYDALINKCEVLGESSPGPTLAELRRIRGEEAQHFLLLNKAVTSLGGDPTVQSPCADVAAVASLGLLQVLTDPRTSVPQCLQAILTAELTDNDGWRMLIDLSGTLGHADLAAEFQKALENEEEHLESVRGWLSEEVLKQAQA
ncbi:MAG TPA: ferritin-like domain-containing protein [Pyrinomonadaceae bacterium]|jgi:bacterioferritin (cytochrome b1)